MTIISTNDLTTSTQRELVAIPDWSADDYKTCEPFEYLYRFKDNRFIMVQIREQMKVRAGAAGVKNFITLWNAFLETKRQANVSIECNVTEFEDQPIELMCGEYRCDEYGITTFDKYGFEIEVCSHPILPVRRLINIDSGEVKIELAFKRGNAWRTLIIDNVVLSSAQRIVDLARQGIAVTSENARDMVRYLSTIESLNYDRLEEINSVGRLGWIKDYGFSPYVDNLQFDGEASFRNMFGAVDQCGDCSVWLDCVKDIRKRGLIARIMLAASFASVLVDPCHALPFFVHIWGGTEAGKTLGLMLAASVWANPAMGEYIHTFNSTAVGLELTAGLCNSLPLCVDELQIVRDRKNFDSTIYMMTEGIGKSRGAKGGGVQTLQTWRNCIITTGEMPINNPGSGGGAVNRVIEIDCKDEKLFDQPREAAMTLRNNYGHAGKAFIEALQGEGALDKARSLYAEMSRQLASGSSTEKQTMAGALLLTADALAEETIFNDGVRLTITDIEAFLTTREDVDQNARAYDWLLDFVASNPVRFMPAPANNGECWGLQDDEYVYFIKSAFDAKMQEGGFNSSSFLSWAKRCDKIECDAQGKTTKSKWVNGGRTRCVWLKHPPLSRGEEVTEEDSLPF